MVCVHKLKCMGVCKYLSGISGAGEVYLNTAMAFFDPGEVYTN